MVYYSPEDYFYPRSPCGERHFGREIILVEIQFLSTLSLRRATIIGLGFHTEIGDFYPRSPCGERLKFDNEEARAAFISIHALLAESDPADRCGVSYPS